MLRVALSRSVTHIRPAFQSCRTLAAGPTTSPDGIPASLRRGADQHDITNMDILEDRIKRQGKIREVTIGGQKQKWNYRSEVVGALGLDKNHTNIWITYGFIIIFGFGAFVWVKSNVVRGRQEEMQERERIRRSMNLLGADRKKIAVVDTD